MLSKTASHAKWICLLTTLITVFALLLEQDKEPAADNFGYSANTASNTAAVTESAAAVQTAGNASIVQASAPVSRPADPLPSPSSPVSAAGQTGKQTEQQSQTNDKLYKFTPSFKTDLSKYAAVEVVATGYYAGKESTGKSPGHPEYGVTRSGVKVRRDDRSFSTIAADPAVFPLGTILYIPGYGYGIVADTGSAVKGNRIDLYFDTKDQVYKEWGKKTLKVFVVKKGEGKVTEAMISQMKSEILS